MAEATGPSARAVEKLLVPFRDVRLTPKELEAKACVAEARARMMLGVYRHGATTTAVSSAVPQPARYLDTQGARQVGTLMGLLKRTWASSDMARMMPTAIHLPTDMHAAVNALRQGADGSAAHTAEGSAAAIASASTAFQAASSQVATRLTKVDELIVMLQGLSFSGDIDIERGGLTPAADAQLSALHIPSGVDPGDTMEFPAFTSALDIMMHAPSTAICAYLDAEGDPHMRSLIQPTLSRQVAPSSPAIIAAGAGIEHAADKLPSTTGNTDTDPGSTSSSDESIADGGGPCAPSDPTGGADGPGPTTRRSRRTNLGQQGTPYWMGVTAVKPPH